MNRYLTSFYRKPVGSAIITALLLLAFVASIAILIQTRIKVYVSQSNELITYDRKNLALQYAIAWAKATLIKQDISNIEPIEMPPFVQDQFQIQAELYDMNALVNINNLQDETFVPGFIKFIAQVSSEHEAELITPIIMKAHLFLKAPENQGYYFQFRDDFQQKYSLPLELYQQIKPFLTTLPPKSKININTALPATLWILDNMTRENEKTLIQTREAHPFQTVTELSKINSQKKLMLPLEKLTLQSDWFLLKTSTIFNQRKNVEYQLLKREISDNGGKSETKIIQFWQSSEVW